MTQIEQNSGQNTGRGILMMLAAIATFTSMDALAKYLITSGYPAMQVIWARYTGQTVIVLLVFLPRLGQVLRTRAPGMQALRSLFQFGATAFFFLSLGHIGLAEATALTDINPMLITLGAALFLGEKVGWRRWAAVVAGFIGILIVLKPGSGVFTAEAALPFAGAIMFAVYGLLTRLVGRDDPATTSFFWTGMSGAVAITLVGIWHWEPIAGRDIPWLLLLCLGAACAHFLLIKAYELAEASALQPFSYTQLVWVSIFGVTIFGETLAPNVALGGAIVVGAGLFTWWRSRQRERAGQS